MSVALFFALLGGVILLGFLGDLLFRLTRIPSVLLLMGIGVALGPAAGLIRSEVLAQVAPYFGTLALGFIATLLWARRLGVSRFARLNRRLVVCDRRLLLVMAPRGLAAAVMAS